MGSILCLTGWGQKYDSLESSIDQKIRRFYQINSLNYSSYKNFNDFVATLKNVENPDAIIGWSLGGQIALRLISSKIFSPKKLILIAPPFQLVKDHRIQAGMSQKIYEDFYNSLKTAPTDTLKKFAILSIMNDKNRAEIMANIKIDDSNGSHLISWLEELKKFSCFDIDFGNVPPTQFLIGKGDMIVHPSQAQYFEERISQIRVNYFSGCGHAPHLNNNKLFNEILLETLAP